MKNKVILITGATSGIGKALAECFGKNGSKVVITGRNIDKLNETAKYLTQQNIEVLSIQADVSIEADNQKMVEKTLAHFGKIDVLINNAGTSMRAMFADVDTEVIRQIMDINFFGTVYATKAALPAILQSKGSIIGISSIAGVRGVPARTGYSASKFAMNGFLEALRTELLYSGVHVLTACPGFTTSNIRNVSLTKDGTMQGESPRDEAKMMSAEECAEHIYRATLKRKKFLYLTALGKLTVFMNKFFGGYFDHFVYKEMSKEKNAPMKK